MTRTEFNEIFRILVSECYVPRDSMETWAVALMDLDADDVRRNVQQYRAAKQFAVNLVCLPSEVRRECLLFHGYDKITWDAIREAGASGGGVYV